MDMRPGQGPLMPTLAPPPGLGLPPGPLGLPPPPGLGHPGYPGSGEVTICILILCGVSVCMSAQNYAKCSEPNTGTLTMLEL